VSVSPDYFQLFGLPTRLAVSGEDLQTKFYELSRKFHPDKFARKPEAEKQAALNASSLLNDAYRTLRDPVKRAEYVLKQQGFDIGEQRSKDVPAELLEEVFELNMALEEMRSGDESVRPQLVKASENFNGMLAGVDRQLEDLFAKYDGNPGGETLGEIRGVLNRRKYILNLVNEVNGALTAK
jgi:molecular chaperone HscB